MKITIQMRTFPTLYKRTKTGTIQYWKISVENPVRQKTDGDWATINKESGQLGTKQPIRHYEKVSKGKQKRNYIEQAEFQAESDWKKKRDEGYKSLEDLGISTANDSYKHYRTEDDREIPSYGDLPTLLEKKLPQFNTDASGNVKPMKAPTKPWIKNGKTTYPKHIGKKLDGVRAFLNIDGLSATFTSSSGKPYTILNHLQLEVEKYLQSINNTESFKLDGEIYKHGWLLEDINAAVKKLRPETTDLQYWIFDYPTIGDQPQTVRTKAVVDICNKINSPLIKCEEFTIVNNDAEVQKFHDEQCFAFGYEGAMLKSLSGTYQPGQRSSYWCKVKMFDDAEFEVLDFELGQRGTEDLLIKCRVEEGTYDKQHTDGTFLVKMMGTREKKEEYWNNKHNIISKVPLTVKYFGLSKYGIPNLPSGKAFREDLP